MLDYVFIGSNCMDREYYSNMLNALVLALILKKIFNTEQHYTNILIL